MKKFLLPLLFFPALAQAGEFDWGISGQLNALYGYTDYSSPKNNHPKNNHVPIYGELNSWIAYSFSDAYQISANLDINGGLDRDLENYNQGDWGEEFYIIGDTPYGRFMMGQTYNVAYQFHVGSPQTGIANQNNNFVTDFIKNPNWQRDKRGTIFNSVNSTAINTDGVAPKITYITPEYYGTILGFSYVPETYNRRGLISKSAIYKDNSGYIAAIYNQSELGYYTLESSLAYAFYEDISSEVSAGLKISRGGWSLGGSIRQNNKEGDISTEKYDSFRDSFAWEVGIGYEIGPFSTSLSYFCSRANNITAKDEIVSFSNEYQINKNFNLYFLAEYAKFQNSEEQIEGYAAITGIGFNF